MIIVCDLDRTLIPNGPQEYDGSLPEFFKLVKTIPGLVLVYATGRNLKLFEEGEREYNLEKPDYLLGAVGTEVFKKEVKNHDGQILEKMTPDGNWEDYVKEKHPNWNREKIVDDLADMFDSRNLFLQEDELQNRNKISYYLKDLNLKDDILQKISDYLIEEKIKAEVVYSFDPHKGSGLVDVLPKHATKLGALQFLLEKLEEDKENVIYFGDSGNDLLPLTSGFKAVLVENAPQEVKEEALEIVKNNHSENKLYIAKGSYSAGVIDGLKYFDVI